MWRVVFPVLFAVGCTSSTAETDPVVTQYQSDVATMRALVTQHVADVDAATSVDEVAALEDTYASDWADQMAAMNGTMGMMNDCTMMDDGMMSGAMDMMGMMDDEVSGHMGDHASHTDVSMCQQAEADHADAMGMNLDQMDGYADGWMNGGMMCGGM